MDDQGRIVAAGWFRQYDVTYMTVVRVLPTGKMDASFDSDGRVIFTADGQEAKVSWVGIDEKGRIVVTGSTDSCPTTRPSPGSSRTEPSTPTSRATAR